MATLPTPPAFKGDWITPDHPEYSQAISRWAANAERRAKAVAFVKDEEDVALVLKYAQENKIAIAVRSGGHSAAGTSSIEGGIVIDLSRHLNAVVVDVEKKLAKVGGGALWGTVDVACIAHGLATPAGTVNHTGVGGLLLHGGYGFLTGEHGLVLDNLVQATIVTADQKVHTISVVDNPDLFWAVRGAGSNFGVVTEFVLKLYPQRSTVFAGLAFFHPNKLNALMDVLTGWWNKGPSPKETIFLVLTKGPDGNPAVLLLLFYNGSEAEGRTQFQKFFDLEPLVNMIKEIPFEELNTLQNAFATPGKNYYMKGFFTSKPDPTIAQAVLDYANKVSVDGLSVAVVCEYIPMDKVLSHPQDSTSHIRRTRISNVVLASWPTKDDATSGVGGVDLNTLRKTLNEGVNLILTNDELETASNTGYGNYISEEVAPGSAASKEMRAGADLLFAENYPRLQQLKKLYDPNQVFSKWCPILPA